MNEFKERMAKTIQKCNDKVENWTNWMNDLEELYPYDVAAGLVSKITKIKHIDDTKLLYTSDTSIVLKTSGKNRNTFDIIGENLSKWLESFDIVEAINISVVGCKENPVATINKTKKGIKIEKYDSFSKYTEAKFSHIAINSDVNNNTIELQLNNRNSNVIKRINDTIERLKQSADNTK